MKTQFLLGAFLLSSIAYSQVGIKTSTPEATLDIRAKNHNGAVTATDGILVPRVNSLANSGSVNGQLVYLIADTTAPTFAKGFYYWDGASWQPLSSTAGIGLYDTTQDLWNDVSGNVTLPTGSVAIGSTTPHASAVLDMSSVTNKGMIAPNVALTSITDQVTVANPKKGLLVYNTGTSTLTTAGYVYWNGTEWRTLYNTSAANPAITGLNCANAYVSPTTFTNGSPYSGTITIPYTGGNGGSYNAGTPFTQNGLTFTLQAGVLSSSTGSITYSVSGTPNFSSPSTKTVPFTFLGQTCNAIIGAANTFSIGETRGFTVAVPASTFLINTSSNWMTGSSDPTGTTNIGTVNGRSMIAAANKLSDPNVIIVKGLRLDFLNEGTGSSVRPVVYNTTSSVIRYHTSGLSTADAVLNGVSNYVAPGYFGQYMDGNSDFTCSNNNSAEFTSVQLTFDDGQWYKVEFHATRVDDVYHGYWVVTRVQ